MRTMLAESHPPDPTHQLAWRICYAKVFTSLWFSPRVLLPGFRIACHLRPPDPCRCHGARGLYPLDTRGSKDIQISRQFYSFIGCFAPPPEKLRSSPITPVSTPSLISPTTMRKISYATAFVAVAANLIIVRTPLLAFTTQALSSSHQSVISVTTPKWSAIERWTKSVAPNDTITH